MLKSCSMISSYLVIFPNVVNFLITRAPFIGKTKNGTWNGMVGMLLRNETDVVVAGLTYTKGRFAAIDYTVPVFPRWDMFSLSKSFKGV